MDQTPPTPEPTPRDPAPVAATESQPHPAGSRRIKRRLMYAVVGLYAASLAAACVLILRSPVAGTARNGKEQAQSLLSLAQERDFVGWVSIHGPISSSQGGRPWEKGAEQWVRHIKAMSETKGVKAIILDINSPGGSVGAVQEIYSAILRAKAETRKPFIARFGDVSASGGYYVASACDKIIAEPGTITGSIGVIFSASSFAGLMNKIGMRNEVIKSGQFKDIGSPMRNMTTEERKLLQTLIDDSYEQFVSAVSEGRKMTVEEVKTLADGRIYTGRQALNVKLVDKLGDLQDALDMAGEMGNIGKNPRVFREVAPIDQFFSILDSKLGFFSGSSVEKMINVSPRLEYRWYGI